MIKKIGRSIIKYIAKIIYPYIREIETEEEQRGLNCSIYSKKVVLGNDVTIQGIPLVSIGKNSTFEIGDGTTIVSDGIINSSSGFVRSSFVLCDSAKMKIGRNVGISNTSFTVRKEIIIEDNVSIGSGCMIADNDFHSLNLNERLKKFDNDIKKETIIIKNGAFIGARTIILKGVTIGENAVVGAGSVVTNDIPSGEIWAGNPIEFKRKL